jgi:hypothetical protein
MNVTNIIYKASFGPDDDCQYQTSFSYIDRLRPDFIELQDVNRGEVFFCYRQNFEAATNGSIEFLRFLVASIVLQTIAALPFTKVGKTSL